MYIFYFISSKLSVLESLLNLILVDSAARSLFSISWLLAHAIKVFVIHLRGSIWVSGKMLIADCHYLRIFLWFLFGEVSSSSGCLGWATLFYCGTP